MWRLKIYVSLIMNNDYFKINLLRTNLENCENSEDINKY